MTYEPTTAALLEALAKRKGVPVALPITEQDRRCGWVRTVGWARYVTREEMEDMNDLPATSEG